jgi:endonuclease III
MPRAKTFRLSKRAHELLQRLDLILDATYGAPEAELDNKPDALDEAIYIILSFQTNLERFKLVWQQLRQAFPTWEDLSRAPVPRVAKILKIGGLHDQKARAIKNLLKAVSARNGECSLQWLRGLDDDEAERALANLPGLSWKGARCVMLYSLGRSTFPVDTNTFRIFRRVGILSSSAVYRRKELHDSLQDAVEPSRRKAFHINLVVHGQRICLPRRPLCWKCAALRLCAMRGVPRKIRTAARRSGTGAPVVCAKVES